MDVRYAVTFKNADGERVARVWVTAKDSFKAEAKARAVCLKTEEMKATIKTLVVSR